jgi:hypothetical protein
MKRAIRMQAKSEEENDFVFLLSDKNAMKQLNWDGDDEFSLNGEMYDVIETRIENNKIIIRTLADKKETTLLKKYATMNRKNSSKNNSSLLLKLVSSSYIVTSNTTIFIKFSTGTSKTFFQSKISSSLVCDVLTPPPQAI